MNADIDNLVYVPVGFGTLYISCTYLGIPAPNITWTHNSSATPLNSAADNSRIRIEVIDGSTTLTILNMTENEGGKYECTADNILGKDIAVTNVRIQCKNIKFY